VPTLSLFFDGVEGSGVPVHIVQEMIREKKIKNFALRVDSGGDDYCANNEAISHNLINDESHNNPEHPFQFVFADVNQSGKYVVSKLSFPSRN